MYDNYDSLSTLLSSLSLRSCKTLRVRGLAIFIVIEMEELARRSAIKDELSNTRCSML